MAAPPILVGDYFLVNALLARQDCTLMHSCCLGHNTSLHLSARDGGSAASMLAALHRRSHPILLPLSCNDRAWTQCISRCDESRSLCRAPTGRHDWQAPAFGVQRRHTGQGQGRSSHEGKGRERRVILDVDLCIIGTTAMACNSQQHS